MLVCKHYMWYNEYLNEVLYGYEGLFETQQEIKRFGSFTVERPSSTDVDAV